MPTLEIPNSEMACAQLEALTGKLNTACAACKQLIDLLGALDTKLASFGNAKLQELNGVR